MNRELLQKDLTHVVSLLQVPLKHNHIVINYNNISIAFHSFVLYCFLKEVLILLTFSNKEEKL